MSRSFNGSSDKLVLASAVATAVPLSIGCWFSPSLAGDGAINNLVALTRSSSNTGFFALRVRGDIAGDPLELVHLSDNGVDSRTVQVAGVSWGDWQWGLAVFEATSRTLYLGISVNSETFATANPITADRTSVGNNDRLVPTHWLNGSVAHVAIWGAALTSGDNAALASGANPAAVQPGSLLAYWRLAGIDSPEPSAMPGGSGLTPTGTTAGGSNPGVWSPSHFHQANTAPGVH